MYLANDLTYTYFFYIKQVTIGIRVLIIEFTDQIQKTNIHVGYTHVDHESGFSDTDLFAGLSPDGVSVPGFVCFCRLSAALAAGLYMALAGRSLCLLEPLLAAPLSPSC